jgi:hypothetical protein
MNKWRLGKIGSKKVEILASLFSILPNCKILVFLLPKVNDKKKQ